VGEGGYQVGNFPTLWSEWNGRYRDTVRDFWRGEPHTRGDFAYRFTGSSDLYEGTGRRPFASINFVTAHDGFTLRDLVSYNEKHNEANGEDNRDGESHNRSWNGGAEGPTDDPEVNRLRTRQQRNFLATLFLSQGVPMLLGGDELGRTQHGNNNGYAQDNELSWFDWERIDEPLLRFTARLIAFRHAHPVFRRKRFFQGRPIRGKEVADIEWFTLDAVPMEDEYWAKGGAHSIAVLLRGDAIPDRDARGERVVDDTFYVVFNGYAEERPARLPEDGGATGWELVIDTAAEDPMPDQPWPFRPGAEVPVSGRSVVVLRRVG
jgi:glycogen operon protein